MNKKLLTMLAACGILAMSAALKAGEQMDYKPYTGSAQLERMKKLVGKWEGLDPKMPGQKAQVEYQMTSGGSVLEEKLFPGTPHEMVSMYHDQNGKLAITHYCMLHNQPQLGLKSSTDKEYKFELVKGSGIKPNEAHMHELTVTFTDDDHIVQHWVSYEGGKRKDDVTLTFARVK